MIHDPRLLLAFAGNAEAGEEWWLGPIPEHGSQSQRLSVSVTD